MWSPASEPSALDDDGEGQLEPGAREGAREDEHDAARKRNADRVDRAHDEDGQIEVGDQEQHEPIGRCFHRPTSAGQEAPDDTQELREPIVVEPVAGAVDAYHLRVAEVCGPPVLDGIAGAALLPVEEQGGARDPRPQRWMSWPRMS